MMIEYVTMTAAEVENILQNAYKHKLNVLLIGTHGVGKTMSCLSILKKNKINYKHFSVPTMINDKLFDFHYHFGKRHNKYMVIADKQYINDVVNKKNKSRKNKKKQKNTFREKL